MSAPTKERGFRAYHHEVIGILSGRQSHFRRIVKPHPYIVCGEGGKAFTSGLMPGTFAYRDTENGLNKYGQCPYGVPGDRLWVRETWVIGDMSDEPFDNLVPDPENGPFTGMAKILYLAHDVQNRDYALPHQWVRMPLDDIERWNEKCETAADEGREIAFPSIFMPRAASRITLEIVSVRVERLREISEEDAKAEGSKIAAPLAGGWWFPESFETEGAKVHGASYRYGYQSLWESIHGAGSWDLNPWVWVLELEKLEVAQ